MAVSDRLTKELFSRRFVAPRQVRPGYPAHLERVPGIDRWAGHPWLHPADSARSVLSCHPGGQDSGTVRTGRTCRRRLARTEHSSTATGCQRSHRLYAAQHPE